MRCPCRKVSETVAYEQCCGPIHKDARAAKLAVQLMRARYCAYAMGNLAFVRDSWHPETRPPHIDPSDGERWISLKIIDSREAGDEATVSFAARSQIKGRASVLSETSRFRRVSGCWYYLDGIVAGA